MDLIVEARYIYEYYLILKVIIIEKLKNEWTKLAMYAGLVTGQNPVSILVAPLWIGA